MKWKLTRPGLELVQKSLSDIGGQVELLARVNTERESHPEATPTNISLLSRSTLNKFLKGPDGDGCSPKIFREICQALDLEFKEVTDFSSGPDLLQEKEEVLKAKENREELNPNILVNLNIFETQIQEDESPSARLAAMNHVLDIICENPEVLNTNHDIISIFQDRAQNDESPSVRIKALNALPTLAAIRAIRN